MVCKFGLSVVVAVRSQAEFKKEQENINANHWDLIYDMFKTTTYISDKLCLSVMHQTGN